MLIQPHEVLDFWFGPPDDPGHALPRACWFRKDAVFDQRIASQFGPLIEAALAGLLQEPGPDDWTRQPLGALALIIVTDQFTRNSLRGTARAFAGDPIALALATELVASGADLQLTGVQRQFVYLPFEHAESLPMQQLALRLFGRLEQDEPALAGLCDWAQQHHDIVARFGRFPHRNAALGRTSTPEELAFLQQPGSGF
jgi:uncharacterized protein (DUF924 family)